MHNVRTLEHCYRSQPLTRMNLDFRDTIWQKLNTEISWTLRQISDCNCRPLRQIWNWYVCSSSFIDYIQKLTHDNLYRFIHWLNQHWSFIVILFAYKQKRKKACDLHSFFYFAYIAQLKIRVEFREVFQSGKMFHRRECLKSTDREDWSLFCLHFRQ